MGTRHPLPSCVVSGAWSWEWEMCSRFAIFGLPRLCGCRYRIVVVLVVEVREDVYALWSCSVEVFWGRASSMVCLVRFHFNSSRDEFITHRVAVWPPLTCRTPLLMVQELLAAMSKKTIVLCIVRSPCIASPCVDNTYASAFSIECCDR